MKILELGELGDFNNLLLTGLVPLYFGKFGLVANS